MIHDLEIEMMVQAKWREQRLFLEPRCRISVVSAIVAGTAITAAAVASGVAVVAGIAAAGVSIAGAVGAFAPSNPGGNGTESTIAPKQQIIDLQTNLAAVAAQEKKVESDLVASQAAQKKWIYAAAGLGILVLVAGAFAVMEKKK